MARTKRLTTKDFVDHLNGDVRLLCNGGDRGRRVASRQQQLSGDIDDGLTSEQGLTAAAAGIVAAARLDVGVYLIHTTVSVT